LVVAWPMAHRRRRWLGASAKAAVNGVGELKLQPAIMRRGLGDEEWTAIRPSAAFRPLMISACPILSFRPCF
jgi:hypothetical protein